MEEKRKGDQGHKESPEFWEKMGKSIEDNLKIQPPKKFHCPDKGVDAIKTKHRYGVDIDCELKKQCGTCRYEKSKL